MKKQLMQELLSAPETPNTGNREIDSTAANDVSGLELDEGGNVDPVLAKYMQFFDAATTAEATQKWGKLVDERQKYLRRSYAGQRNRQRQLESQDEEPQAPAAQSTPSGTIGDIDITNLGPHADEIALEVTEWLKTTGLLPSELVETARGTIAKNVKEHPDIIPQGYKAFQKVLNKYAPSIGKALSPSATQGSATFDPQHPERWAPEMGYSGK